MNEVSDSMLEQEKTAARVAAQGTFKIVVPVTKVSAASLVVSCKLVLGLTNGFKDLAIDGINVARASTANGRSGTGKHRHITGKGSSYKNINKTANRKGATLESIEVSDKTMLGFETIARKYGIEYGLRKNEGSTPPTWDVYFMAKDRATMTQAFREFTNRQLSGKKETPMEQFKRMATRITGLIKPEKIMRQTGHQR